jgi:uncharacterized protein (TIGR00255 family)
MQSMTGFGSASKPLHGVVVTCEMRSVNHRFFTLRCSLPEGCAGFEPLIERLLRTKIQRGTVNVTLMAESEPSGSRSPFDGDRIKQFREELTRVKKSLGYKDPVSFESLLMIPHLWQTNNSHSTKVKLRWEEVEPIAATALKNLVKMRLQEGTAAQDELKMRIDLVRGLAKNIETKAPLVQELFRERILTRLHTIVPEAERTPSSDSLFKEIASMLDRCDISEEVQRLNHHIVQFERLLRDKDKVGRKLDFLNQEMLRETNTIASKAAETRVIDDTIAIKSELERIKEQVENVE